MTSAIRRPARAVVELREQFMRERQPSTDPAVGTDQGVVDFWDGTYLPYSQGRHRASTVKGCLKLWNGTLRDHFAGRTLATYKTHNGSELLTELAKRGLSRNSIAHVRSLASGIFTHAINLGIQMQVFILDHIPAVSEPRGSRKLLFATTAHASLRRISIE